MIKDENLNRALSPTQYILNNLMAGVLIFILGVRFSVAYFSYFCILSAVYIIFCWYCFNRQSGSNKYFFPGINDRALVIVSAGLLLFYSCLFVANALSLKSLDFKIILGFFTYAVPLYVFYFLSQKNRVHWGVLAGLSLIILVNAVYGIFQLSGWAVDSLKDVHRMQGFFKHANSFGMVLTWCIPFLIYFFYKLENKKYKYWAAVILCIGGLCLYCSGSRGAIVSLCTGLIGSLLLYGWFNRKIFSKKIKVSLMIGCLLIAAGTGLGVHYSMQYDRGLGERVFMWQGSIHMWDEHKLSGVGVGKWAENYYSETYHPKDAHEKDMVFPHNMPLYYLSEAGTIGGIGYGTLLLTMLIAAGNILKRQKEVTLAVPLMAVCLAFMAEGMVDATISNKMVSLPYFALIGYSLGSLNVRNKRTNFK